MYTKLEWLVNHILLLTFHTYDAHSVYRLPPSVGLTQACPIYVHLIICICFTHLSEPEPADLQWSGQKLDNLLMCNGIYIANIFANSMESGDIAIYS